MFYNGKLIIWVAWGGADPPGELPGPPKYQFAIVKHKENVQWPGFGSQWPGFWKTRPLCIFHMFYNRKLLIWVAWGGADPPGELPGPPKYQFSIVKHKENAQWPGFLSQWPGFWKTRPLCIFLMFYNGKLIIFVACGGADPPGELPGP